MGAEHRKAARLYSVGIDGKLSMDDMPIHGLIQTHSLDNPITDSAAAATAMASGVKTYNGVIGLDAKLKPVTTVLENAKRKGKLAGIITTTHITHATPAAFASHISSRRYMQDIAEQMLNTGVDVLLGGGEDEFLPISENGCFPEPGERKDGKNLILESAEKGYKHVCNQYSLDLIDSNSTRKLIGLFADEGMKRPYSPSLAKMTSKAIDILSKNSNGFFLLVESGRIDWAAHSNNAKNAIADILQLDEAVEVAKQFASQVNDTLIIVTADHETGGMSVTSSPSGLPGEDGPFTTPKGNTFYVNWSTKGHTAVDVPISSQGPSSEILSGIKDNTFIHDVIFDAL